MVFFSTPVRKTVYLGSIITNDLSSYDSQLSLLIKCGNMYKVVPDFTIRPPKCVTDFYMKVSYVLRLLS